MTQHNSQYYTSVLVKVYLQLLRGDIPQGLTKYKYLKYTHIYGGSVGRVRALMWIIE